MVNRLNFWPLRPVVTHVNRSNSPIDNAEELIAKLNKPLNNGIGLGISVSLIKEILGNSPALVIEVPHNYEKQFKLFMIKGPAAISCIIKTDPGGHKPNLLTSELAKNIIQSTGLKGGGCLQSSTNHPPLNTDILQYITQNRHHSQELVTPVDQPLQTNNLQAKKKSTTSCVKLKMM